MHAESKSIKQATVQGAPLRRPPRPPVSIFHVLQKASPFGAERTNTAQQVSALAYASPRMIVNPRFRIFIETYGGAAFKARRMAQYRKRREKASVEGRRDPDTIERDCEDYEEELEMESSSFSHDRVV